MCAVAGGLINKKKALSVSHQRPGVSQWLLRLDKRGEAKQRETGGALSVPSCNNFRHVRNDMAPGRLSQGNGFPPPRCPHSFSQSFTVHVQAGLYYTRLWANKRSSGKRNWMGSWAGSRVVCLDILAPGPTRRVEISARVTR